jgi:hypothetical protein
LNFPKFWALGRSGDFEAWRWSDTSADDAQTLARDAAARVEAAFKASGGRRLERYLYGDRPLREPVLNMMVDATGTLIAAITRNSYGCDVLNAARAMFVDVDLPEPRGGGLLGSLFGKKKPESDSTLDAAIGKASAWAQSHDGWNWRIYRTKGGLRLLATHAEFDPKEAACSAAFDAVGADPLYRKLCDNQQSFRARLTPKPWRCGVRTPPARWPFQDANAEQAFEKWNGRYATASVSRATCKLLSPGNGAVHPSLQPIVELHDKLTRATSDLPLA